MKKNVNRKTITLIVTEKCNLDCKYCYENHKTSRTMPFEVAKQIIEKNCFEVNDFDELLIEFFGGEPFLNFKLIKQVVSYLETQKLAKPYLLFATTNGTLIHGEIKQWLIEHPQFICGLSIDGTRQMHNINRSNSYDSIDIDFFKNQYPEQGIKMTVSQDTLPNLCEGVLFLQEKGFKVACNLAFGIDWSDVKNRTVLERQLMKLIDYYLLHPNLEPCSILALDIKDIGVDDSQIKHRKWCGTGTHMFTFAPYGQAYPCQFFAPQSIGEKKSKLAQSLDFPRDISVDCLDKKCQDCLIEPLCPTCYGSNFASTGNIFKKDENLCELTKIIMQARAYFRAKQWEKGQLLSLNDNDEQLLLRAIAKIQKTFS